MISLANLSKELTLFLAQAKHHFAYSIAFVGLLLGIFWIDNLLGKRLRIFGIRPRQINGLIGIPFSTFVHGSFNHYFFNAIPLFALSLFLLALGLKTFLWISAGIILQEGCLTWMLGRRGNHIGASALITGYFGFLLALAKLQPTITSLFLAGLTLYYFGGIFFSLFPQEEKTSWESHLFGFLAGLLTAYLYLYISI